MRPLIREFGGYVGASAAAFVLDIGLLWLQVSWFRVPYLSAAAIAFLGGTLFVYWASVRHIFEFRRLEDARIEFAFFLAVGAVGLVVNLAAMYAAVDRLGFHFLLAKFGAAGLTFGVNFGLRRLFLFSRWHRDGAGLSVEEIAP